MNRNLDILLDCALCSAYFPQLIQRGVLCILNTEIHFISTFEFISNIWCKNLGSKTVKGKTLQNCWLSLCSLQDSRTPLIVFCNLLPDWSVTFKKGRTDNRFFLICQKLFNICHGEWLSGLGRVIQIERSTAQTPLGGWLGFGTQPCYEATGNGQVTIAFIQWRTSGDRGCHFIKWPSVSGGTQIEKNGLYSTTPKSISSKSILCHPGVSTSSKSIDEVFRVIVFWNISFKTVNCPARNFV